MAFISNSNVVNIGSLTDVDSAARYQVGLQIQATDSALGTGEFVYLPGVASTATGSVVIFDQYASTTTLATAGSRGPVAVAMAATVASKFGWFQISGSAVVKANTVLAGGNVYATATAGTVDDATVAGDKIDGMRFKTADGTPAAGAAIVQMSRPSMNANG